ncbi:CDC50 like protein [Aspergillus parasiticus SU-1]|uniref:Ligand-effect modulator 3 family n=3 Tax=Aspergillus subgen. Circumdati TaxID=2720871 RepID=A0A5N6D1K6_ASPPA|nr:ligand-effect modulator 3 family [Aspergillus parasiticus]KJK66549.1 CDC50 like protein [Aspergillus parasiticus SU-1]
MMSHTEAARTDDSLGEQETRGDVESDKKAKNRRPANTAFRQQRLKAWQPILTPRSVLPLFFVVGVIFAPIGGLLLWASSEVQEIVIDYSECADKAQRTPVPIPDKVQSSFKSSNQQPNPTWMKYRDEQTNETICRLSFKIPESIEPPVFMYYRLTNFYQNHRRYVKSLDIDQLKGKPVDNKTIDGGSCDPLKLDDSGKAYYPCGLIANSMFNDTIKSPELLNDGNDDDPVVYVMTNKGIAWDSDKELIKTTQYKPGQVVPPPNWQARYPHNYTTEIPDLHDNEEFMVWMRTAALPNFSKLSRRNDTTAMSPGTYQLDIADHFPVTEYGGTKSILISSRTVIGGQNPFMGIAYVVVGGLCVLLGALFTIAHLVRPRKLGDHTYLTWNNEQESSAIATGRDNRFGPNTH